MDFATEKFLPTKVFTDTFLMTRLALFLDVIIEVC